MSNAWPSEPPPCPDASRVRFLLKEQKLATGYAVFRYFAAGSQRGSQREVKGTEVKGTLYEGHRMSVAYG